MKIYQHRASIDGLGNHGSSEMANRQAENARDKLGWYYRDAETYVTDTIGFRQAGLPAANCPG